jgi:hypothetical protein
VKVFNNARQGVPRVNLIEHVLQRRRSTERHADDLERIAIVNRIQGNNVRVLQLGEKIGFAPDVRGDLHDNVPVGQVFLLGEKHPAEGPAAQLAQQVKVAEMRADLRHRVHRPHQAPGRFRILLVQVAKELSVFGVARKGVAPFFQRLGIGLLQVVEESVERPRRGLERLARRGSPFRAGRFRSQPHAHGRFVLRARNDPVRRQ